LHGNHTVRVPWAFDEESVDVLRHFTHLKLRLMPYLWDAAGVATERGLPVMRAMLLESPEDPTCRFLERQYMLGDKLLVAPVFQEDGEVEFYLPPGRWTPLLGGDEIRGGGWRRERHDFFSLPLYVRENSLLAWSAPSSDTELQPQRDYTKDLELQLFALQDGCEARAAVRDHDGHVAFTAAARRNGRRLSIFLQGNGAGCRLLLRNETVSRETANVEVMSGEFGDTVAIPPGTSELELN
jgi:alpha-D-xyloside xylohydrolase